MASARDTGTAWAPPPGFWQALRPWLLAAVWFGGIGLGFWTTKWIEDAYEAACVDHECSSIDGAIQLLRYSIVLNAFAVPAAIMFMRERSRR